MKALDLFTLAVAGLRRRKTRTILSALGIFIGVLCIILMLAIGISGYDEFTQSVENTPDLTRITLVGQSEGNMQGKAVTSSALKAIRQMPHVQAVSPVFGIPLVVQVDNYQAVLYATGISTEILDIKLAAGKSFTDLATLPSLIIGGNAAEESFLEVGSQIPYKKSDASKDSGEEFVGRDVSVRLGYGDDIPEVPTSPEYRAKIVGLTKKSNSYGHEIYINLASAERLAQENESLARELGLPRHGTYESGIVVVDDIENVIEVQDKLKEAGFQTDTALEWIEQTRDEQNRQQMQLFAIGATSLVVAAIGIANTMYASVLERKKDIGIMKTVGMRPRQIQLLFLSESVGIGLVGSFVAVVVSYFVVWSLGSSGTEASVLGVYFAEGMNISIPWWLVLVAMGLAVLTSALAGWYPAYRAAHTSVTEALSGYQSPNPRSSHTLRVEMRRALLSKEQVIAGACFAAVLTIASLSTLQPIVQKTFDGEIDILFGFSVFESSILSTLALFALPIVVTFPYTTSFIDDIKSKFYRSYLPRSKSTDYRRSKAVSTALSGAGVLLMGIVGFGVFLAVILGILTLVFPRYAPHQFAPPGEVAPIVFAALKLVMLAVVSGGLWALVGALLSTVTKNRYVAYAAPFIIYYLLTILNTRYLSSLTLINPQFWIDAEPVWAAGSMGIAMFVIELMVLVALLYMWAMKRVLDSE